MHASWMTTAMTCGRKREERKKKWLESTSGRRTTISKREKKPSRVVAVPTFTQERVDGKKNSVQFVPKQRWIS
jgi:hypothetical protein